MTYFNLAVFCENETIKIKAETIYKISSEEATKPVQTPCVITSLEDLPSLPFSNASDRVFFDFSSLATDLNTLTQTSITFSGYEYPPSWEGRDIEQFKIDAVIYELPTQPLLAINFILLLHYSQYNDGVRYNRPFKECLVGNQIDYCLPIFEGNFDNVRAFFDEIVYIPLPSDCSLSKEEKSRVIFLESHLLINNFWKILENPPNRYQDVFTHLNTFFQGSLSRYINYGSLNNTYESDQFLLEQYKEMLPELKRLNTLNHSNPLKNNGFFSFSEKGSVNPERSSRICQCTIL